MRLGPAHSLSIINNLTANYQCKGAKKFTQHSPKTSENVGNHNELVSFVGARIDVTWNGANAKHSYPFN